MVAAEQILNKLPPKLVRGIISITDFYYVHGSQHFTAAKNVYTKYKKTPILTVEMGNNNMFATKVNPPKNRLHQKCTIPY